MNILVLLISLVLPLTTFAQAPQAPLEPTPTVAPLPLNEEKFAAIVQFAEGKQEYDFKDLILFDKTIIIPKNSYLKVITQKRCVAVFYENSQIQTPVDKVSPWKVLSGTARWICPEEKVERIVFKDSEIQVQTGEFLLHNNQLTALKSSVRTGDKELITENIYLYKKGQWLRLKNQPDPYDLWKKQTKFPAPLESIRLHTEKPIDPYVTRIFLNVAPIGLSGFYHHEEENGYSDYGSESHAFRLGVNFPWKSKSIFGFLEYSESDGENNENFGPPPIGTKSIQVESATMGVGLRHSHVNSSSFYYYVGLTRVDMKFHLHPDASSYYDGEIIYPYNVSVGAGYQKIFWSKNWISLMVGIDAKLTQSLSQGKSNYYNFPFGGNSDIRSAATSYSSFLYLGPVFNF